MPAKYINSLKKILVFVLALSVLPIPGLEFWVYIHSGTIFWLIFLAFLIFSAEAYSQQKSRLGTLFLLMGLYYAPFSSLRFRVISFLIDRLHLPGFLFLIVDVAIIAFLAHDSFTKPRTPKEVIEQPPDIDNPGSKRSFWKRKTL